MDYGDHEIIEEDYWLFKNIKGLKPIKAVQGLGSFTTIHFGRDFSEEVKTRTGTKIRQYGEWRLWIYM